MNKIKQKAYNERVVYIKNMNLLYEVFKNEQYISQNENEVFELLQKMPMETINEIIEYLVAKSERLDLVDCYTNPLLFKFIIIQYIQELRQS